MKALPIHPSLIDASNWLQKAYAAVGEPRRSLEILEAMAEHVQAARKSLGLEPGYFTKDREIAV